MLVAATINVASGILKLLSESFDLDWFGLLIVNNNRCDSVPPAVHIVQGYLDLVYKIQFSGHLGGHLNG